MQRGRTCFAAIQRIKIALAVIQLHCERYASELRSLSSQRNVHVLTLRHVSVLYPAQRVQAWPFAKGSASRDYFLSKQAPIKLGATCIARAHSRSIRNIRDRCGAAQRA